MSTPFFSICIAAYKAERYIGACLESIAAQTCQDYEVIIIDDGSPEPLAIDPALAYRLSSCLLIRTANGGPYAARQRAYDESRGDVLLTVDADDALVDCDALSKLREAFSDEADVVIFNATDSKVSMRRLFDLTALDQHGYIDPGQVWSEYTTSYYLNSLWCKAFRRKLYSTSDKTNRPRLLMAEDRLQSLEVMIEAQSFRLIDEPLYYYRPNPVSTTNAGYNPAYFRQQCYVEERVLEFMRTRDMPLDGWASYFLNLASGVLLGIRYNSSLSRADRCVVYKSIREEPVVKTAMPFLEEANLSGIATLRLQLLKTNRLVALDSFMLPWKCGSMIKRLIKQ